MEPACRRWYSRGIFIYFPTLLFKGGSFNKLIPVFLEASCDEMLEQGGEKSENPLGETTLPQSPEEGLGKDHVPGGSGIAPQPCQPLPDLLPPALFWQGGFPEQTWGSDPISAVTTMLL